MKSERLLLRDARSLTFDASSFEMAETLIKERKCFLDAWKKNCSKIRSEVKYEIDE